MQSKISLELLEMLKVVDTPTLANAIEKLNVRNDITGFCNMDISCMFPEFDSMVGVTITAEVESTNPDCSSELGKEFIKLCQLCEKSALPTVIVFKEIGAHPELSAHCGEIMACIFNKLGVVGLVTDSAVRDINEAKKIGFQYFSHGAVASHGSFRVVRTQVPITVCGMRIKPGDLVHGDVNGLINVPYDGLDKLPAMIEMVRQSESKLLDYIHSDSFSLDGLKDILIH